MKLKLPEGTFRAYLFDCDGTVVDSMPLHFIAWNKALSEWGGHYDEELFYSWGGVPTVKIIESLNKMQGLNMPVQQLAEHKEELYYELLPQLKPIPEVLEQMDAMQGRIPFAVVSGSSHRSIIKSLTAVKLLDRFDLLVGSEDYKRGKPAPDAFLVAAEKLKLDPKDCLVFEDADIGIQAATAAGMATVRVPSPLERRKEAEAAAAAAKTVQTAQ